MKRFVLILVFAVLSAVIFASPFGLTMGMTIEEITEQCEENPSFVENDIYLVKPIKRHPLMDTHVLYYTTVLII